MNLSVYIKYIAIKLSDELNYRVNTLIKLFTGFFSTYVFIKVWSIATTQSIISVSDQEVAMIISYLIIARAINQMMYWPMFITELYKTGNISRYLIYPVKFIGVLYSQAIGIMFSSVITSVIPTFIFLVMVFGITIKIQFLNLLFGLLFFLLGSYVFINFYIVIDLLSIWIIDTRGLSLILSSLITLFSGSIIPLWLLPEPFKTIGYSLPFRYMIDSCASVVVGKVNISESYAQLFNLIGWVVIMSLLVSVVWRFARKKIVIVGE